MSLHILFLLVICKFLYLQSTWFPAAALATVWQETYVEAAISAFLLILRQYKTSIPNPQGLRLSIMHVNLLGLNQVILLRTLWRTSWTPKSGPTSPSVQLPGMDPVPSGMSSEAVALCE